MNPGTSIAPTRRSFRRSKRPSSAPCADMKRVVLLSSMALAGAQAIAVLPASRHNPGKFPVEATPQFVILGSDDNYNPEGLRWLLDALRQRTNPSGPHPQASTFDGAPARMTFFVN